MTSILSINTWRRDRRLWLCTMALCLGVYGCASTYSARGGYEHLRPTVVSTALSMQGKPYRYGGTTPAGFDCSGLMHYTFRQAGLNIPRNSYDQYKASSPVYINRLQPGDLLFFRTLGGTFVSHVGLYIGDNRFVHAPGNGRQVSIDNLDTEYWQKRLVGAGSLL